ncbi:DUF6221 family protein [Verrucosispora sp. TAA-831]|uniref:DUF6221 family protein n=1 Tax=Verrucosispora sp. TAA-831 TaxID=3422227 RepID=UPI003D6F128C
MSGDLSTWLTAQIDAAEARTRERLYWAQQTILTLKDPRLLGKYIPGWHDWPDVERVCTERLAELAAARRILDAHADALRMHRLMSEADDDAKWDWLFKSEALEGAVRLLAVPYAGQPGYRDEWRTDA